MLAASRLTRVPGTSVSPVKSTLLPAEEFTNDLDRRLHVVVGRFSAHRQRQYFTAQALDALQMWIRQSKRVMAPHRARPVDERFDSVLAQERPQLVATRSPNHIVLIRVALTRLVEMR